MNSVFFTTQALQEEVSQRLIQARELLDQQREKYGDDTSELPEELAQQVAALEELQDQLEGDLKQRSRSLAEARDSRQEYHTNVDIMKSWIEEATSQLQTDQEGLEEESEKYKVPVLGIQ